MKKIISIMLISLMGMVANAQFFMKLTTTDNSITTYSLDGLKFIHDNNNARIIISNDSIILPLNQLQKMQFVQNEEPLFGDVNGDGQINIADVYFIIDAIIDDSHVGTFDVNSDGVFNIVDVNAVIDCILWSHY